MSPSPSLPPLVILAYVMNLALIVYAWTMPRLRNYAAVHLGLDLVRLAFVLVPVGPRPFTGWSFALLLLDGALLLLDVVFLAMFIRLIWFPVAGLMATALVYVGMTYPRLSGEPLESFYCVAMLVGLLYVVGGCVTSKQWRKHVDASSACLLGLAASGLVGTIVALASPGSWYLVQAGNLLAYFLTCVACVNVRTLDRR